MTPPIANKEWKISKHAVDGNQASKVCSSDNASGYNYSVYNNGHETCPVTIIMTFMNQIASLITDRIIILYNKNYKNTMTSSTIQKGKLEAQDYLVAGLLAN